jgi:hypothetical protein
MQVAVVELTETERTEFQRCEQRIEQSAQAVDDMFEALTAIRDKKLYRETHRDFESYCQARWGKTWRRWRQLMQSQSVTGSLQDAIAAGQIKYLPTTEGQTRPLNSVPLDERVAVAVIAEQLAGDKEPTGAQYEAAKLKQQVYNTRFSPLIQRMDRGEVTPARALEVATALQSCEPVVRGDLLRLKASDKALMLELNRLKREGRSTYDEVAASGFLQFTDGRALPVEKATAADLRRLLDEKYAEHRRLGALERDLSLKLEPIIVTIYGNDQKRTLKALKQALSEGQMDALHTLFLER